MTPRERVKASAHVCASNANVVSCYGLWRRINLQHCNSFTLMRSCCLSLRVRNSFCCELKPKYMTQNVAETAASTRTNDCPLPGLPHPPSCCPLPPAWLLLFYPISISNPIPVCRPSLSLPGTLYAPTQLFCMLHFNNLRGETSANSFCTKWNGWLADTV